MITPNRHDVAAAHDNVEAARNRLFGTLSLVQDRLKPGNLAQDAVESAAVGMMTVARKGADAVRSRPLAAAAVVGAVGLVMARGWIGRLIGGRDETSEARAGLKNKRAPRATKGSTK